mgnify:FL=1
MATLSKLNLKIKAMHCKSCGTLIEEALQEINVKAEANHETGIVNVEFDEKQVQLKKIEEVIEKLGYKAE